MKQSQDKDSGRPIRINIEHYKRIRQEAFDREVTMKEVLDNMIDYYYKQMDRGEGHK